MTLDWADSTPNEYAAGAELVAELSAYLDGRPARVVVTALATLLADVAAAAPSERESEYVAAMAACALGMAASERDDDGLRPLEVERTACACGALAVDVCPSCGRAFCQSCAERPYAFCCDTEREPSERELPEDEP